MTGIERLRQMAEDFKNVKTAEHCTFIVNTWRGRYIDDAIGDIADQIEHEHAEDSEAIAWVREHGGLENVKESLAALELFAEGIEMDTGCAFYDESMGERCVALRNEVKSRLMPEGMEWLLEVWPKWSNGEYCKFGDWWVSDNYGEPKPKQFRKLSIYTPEQLDEWGQGDGESYGYEWDFVRPSDPKYRPDKVEPPAPKVLDADGAEIRVGDTVCGTRDMEPMRVVDTDYRECGFKRIKCEKEGEGFFFYCADELTHRLPILAADGRPLREGETVWNVKTGERYVVGAFDGGCVNVSDGRGGGLQLLPSQITHERPDSWERLEEDAGKNPFNYCKDVGHRLDTFENSEAYKARDIVRRTKALAERDAK